MKAIDTAYGGYLFRSRLEARWAVFFDALKLPYEYEKEGYDLGGELGWYLPDFFLPTVRSGVWIEVKGDPAQADAAKHKLRALTYATRLDSMLVCGDPLSTIPSGDWSPPWHERNAANGDMNYYMPPDPSWVEGGDDVGSDSPYLFCVCPRCLKVGIECDGRGARVCTFWRSGSDLASVTLAAAACRRSSARDDGKGYSYDHPKILAAAEAARSARFEPKLRMVGA